MESLILVHSALTPRCSHVRETRLSQEPVPLGLNGAYAGRQHVHRFTNHFISRCCPMLDYMRPTTERSRRIPISHHPSATFSPLHAGPMDGVGWGAEAVYHCSRVEIARPPQLSLILFLLLFSCTLIYYIPARHDGSPVPRSHALDDAARACEAHNARG